MIIPTRLKTALLSLFVLPAIACSSSTTSSVKPKAPLEVAEDPAPEIPSVGTKDVDTEGELTVAERVDALVATGTVTSSGVGAGGVKSPSYKAYEALVTTATPSELQALAGHTSPIVRAYVAAHLARHEPKAHASLAHSLNDSASISAQYGCMMMPTTVAAHVADQLCYVRTYESSTSAEALLRGAADDAKSPAHRSATECLARPVAR